MVRSPQQRYRDLMAALDRPMIPQVVGDDDTIVLIAQGLVAENLDNPEYQRAVVEFTCALLGLTVGCAADIGELIGVDR